MAVHTPIVVSGPNAFYQAKDYEAKTREELGKPGLVSPVYHANLPPIEDRSTVVSALAGVFFPKVTAALQEVAQRAILPATITRGEIETFSSLVGKAPPDMPISPEENRQKIPGVPGWKFKRISIEAGGCMVDAILVVKETNDPTRWTLMSQGNGGNYEAQLQEGGLYGFLDQLKSNAILFNYPGVNSSTGEVTVPNLVASYLGTLDFTENVLGAKQIIAYGFSIGGGVQGEAFKDHIPKQGVQYLLVKDRTFSRLSDVAQSMVNPVAKIGMNLLGWELDPYSSSTHLIHPEIIVQASRKPTVALLDNADQVKNDGVISAVDSLAFSILKEKAFPNKRVLGIPYEHNRPIWKEPLLASTIIDMLDPGKKDLELQKGRSGSGKENESPLPAQESKEDDEALETAYLQSYVDEVLKSPFPKPKVAEAAASQELALIVGAWRPGFENQRTLALDYSSPLAKMVHSSNPDFHPDFVGDILQIPEATLGQYNKIVFQGCCSASAATGAIPCDDSQGYGEMDPKKLAQKMKTSISSKGGYVFIRHCLGSAHPNGIINPQKRQQLINEFKAVGMHLVDKASEMYRTGPEVIDECLNDCLCDDPLNERLSASHSMDSDQLKKFQTMKATVQNEWQSANGAMIFYCPSNYDLLVERRTGLERQLRAVSAQKKIAEKNRAKVNEKTDPFDYAMETKKLNAAVREEQSLKNELMELNWDLLEEQRRSGAFFE